MAQPQMYPQNFPPPPVAAPRRDPQRRRRIGLIVLLAVAALVFGGIFLANRAQRAADPDSATVGDCVTRSGADDLKVVPCGDAKAAFTVVGKVGNKSQVDLSLSSAEICKPFPAAKSAFWKGKAGQKGYILCLAPK